MILNGVIFSGVLRGKPLVKIFFHRLVGMLGFEPYKGTMDVKLEHKIDIDLYATKSIEHILMDGKKHVDARLAPVDLIIRRDGKEERHSCWALQEAHGIYERDVVELIAKEKLKEKFGLEDGNLVWLEFTETGNKKKPGFLSRLRPHREATLMKR